MSSWLARLAALYGLSVRQLLEHNLGSVSPLVSGAREDDLDWDPPPGLLHALAERTGVDLAELRLATIAGWTPWLLDTLEPVDGSEAFHTYVRQDSVLLPLGRAGRNTVSDWRPWLPMRAKEWRTGRRVCPVCATDADRGVPLTAGLPLMISCGEHRCRLEPEAPVRIALAMGEPLPGRAVPEAVAELDRLTWEGLITGEVTLVGRPVHVGVWFRLLRTLLDEVSLSSARVGSRSATFLERVWVATGRPVRGGLNIWRPYERLDTPYQEAMLEAAAAAVQMTATGAIMAQGSLGDLINHLGHRRVYDGHQPRTYPDRWGNLHEEADAFFVSALTESGPARQLLHIFTWRCGTLAAFQRERQFLIGLGIPEAFLPDARGLGRHDLLTGPG